MAQQAAAAKAQREPQNPAANMLLSFAQQNKPEEIERILEVSKMELRWGALDPSEGNSVGQTALHVACLWGNFEAAECLVNNKVRELWPFSRVVSFLFCGGVCWMRSERWVSHLALFVCVCLFFLFFAQADVNRCNTLTGGTPLHITCSSPKALEGRLKCAKLLLDHGADPLLPDSRGMTPMEYAAEEPEMAALFEPYAARANALTAEGAAAGAITNGESGDE